MAFMSVLGGNNNLLLKVFRDEPELLRLVLGLIDGYRANDL